MNINMRRKTNNIPILESVAHTCKCLQTKPDSICEADSPGPKSSRILHKQSKKQQNHVSDYK